MKLTEIIKELESIAPLSLQEDYDNAGLILGKNNADVKKALICLDLTDQTLEEAIDTNCDLIITHHPIIFKGLKKLNGKTLVERIVIKALKHDICIYAIHTNLDNVISGVNGMIAEKLSLKNVRILQPKNKQLRKLTTFCPLDRSSEVREALFAAGAGSIGDYDSCSFNMEGTGTFRASDSANPYIGEKGKLHYEKEDRIEVIYPVYKEREVLKQLLTSHPYEEVAYDIYPLENELKGIGAGIIGDLEENMSEKEFLMKLKSVFNTPTIRHTAFLNKKVKKIAVCGGSGSFLISKVKSVGADVFITGDIKYHDFFEADREILLADIGHYESEQFTKELIYNILIKKFPTFALRISEKEVNPVRYLK